MKKPEPEDRRTIGSCSSSSSGPIRGPKKKWKGSRGISRPLPGSPTSLEYTDTTDGITWSASATKSGTPAAVATGAAAAERHLRRRSVGGRPAA